MSFFEFVDEPSGSMEYGKVLIKKANKNFQITKPIFPANWAHYLKQGCPWRFIVQDPQETTCLYPLLSPYCNEKALTSGRSPKIDSRHRQDLFHPSSRRPDET